MDSAKPATDRRKFIFKAFLLTVVAVLLAVAAAFIVTLGPSLLNLPRSRQLDAAISLKEHDNEGGAAAIEKVFQDAHAAHLPTIVETGLYRQYAEAMYKKDEIADGDAAVEKAIALFPGDPEPNSSEADMLTHLYQDRAGSHYYAYSQDRTLDSGAKDQEKSLAVAEKAFGPDHEQTIFKAPTLALIYADSGRTADAEKIMQRCLDSIRTKASSRECSWFVYSILSRMRAIQHRYPESVKAFVEARKVATDKRQTDRAWFEFSEGLKQSQPPQGTGWKKADALLKKGKFDELERLLSVCLANHASEGMGDWLIDDYYWGVDGGYNNLQEEEFAQKTNDIKKWLTHNPHSIFARPALAHACLFSFWGLRNANPTKESARQMEKRLKLAREILDSDPGIQKKNPVASTAYIRLLLAEGRDKEEILKVADDCHKAFPTYIGIDFWTAKFLSGRWLGSDEEASHYIQTRADKLGTYKGDEAFTQIYHYLTDPDQNIFDLPAQSSPEWKRMKAGYKRIFIDYPNDMDARLQGIGDALRCDDNDFVAQIFDDKKNSNR
jgi:tetratricopeptide (TPR) repeat protein